MPELDPEAPLRSADEVLPKVYGAVQRLERSARRQRRAVRAGAAAIALLLAVGVGSVVQHDEPDRSEVVTRPEVPDTPDRTTPRPGPTVPGLGPAVPVTGGPTATGLSSGTGGPSGTVVPSAPSPPRVVVAFDRGAPVGGPYEAVVLRPGAGQVEVQAPAVPDRTFPSLSPDGGAIAYQSTSSNVLSGLKTIWDVFVRRLDGSPATQLTFSATSPDNGAQFPSWSPDGARLVMNCPVPYQGLCTTARDGGDVRHVVEGSAGLFQATFAPEGTRLAALRTENPRYEARIVTFAPDGSNQRVVPSRPIRRIAAPMWLLAGGRYATLIEGGTPADGEGRVITVDIVTGEITTPPALPLVTGMAPCGGGWVVLALAEPFGPGQPGDLVLVGLDGSSPVVLLGGPRAARLSPTSCVRSSR